MLKWCCGVGTEPLRGGAGCVIASFQERRWQAKGIAAPVVFFFLSFIFTLKYLVSASASVNH